jgi:hypothetical protein
MPKSFEKELRRRGGVVRWRTKSLGKKKYARVAVVRKAGKRGGRTVVGEIHEKGE